jgi:ribosomal protein S18 acetylase RimI-like enzyme
VEQYAVKMPSNQRFYELLEDWRFYFRTYSWRHALTQTGRQLLELPYRRIHYLMYVRLLSEPMPGLKASPGVTIRQFDPSDLLAIANIDRPSEARLCAYRLAMGHIGLVAECDHVIAGYAWACSQVEPKIERVEIQLTAGDFLCTDAYTAPAYRGHGIHTMLTLARLKIMQALGYQRAICYIERHNVASIRTWKKFGGQHIGDIDYIRLGSRRWVHSQPRGFNGMLAELVKEK